MTGLRVATYNLYLGADLSLLFAAEDVGQLGERVAVIRGQLEATRFDERARAVAAILAWERPDLVGLQEVSCWTIATPDGERVLDSLSTLVDALEKAGCGYDTHAVNPNFGGSMPVSETETVGLLGADVTLVRRDGPVQVVDETTATYAERHLVVTAVPGVSFPVERGWSRVDVRVEGRPLRFVTTHIEAYDGAVRAAQRDELVEANAGVAGPVVLVGDFNATPDLVGMPDGWTDAWSGDGGFTFGQAADLANEASTMSERIDYVWVRGAAVVDARVVGDRPGDRSSPHGLWPSDHAGVVVDLDL